MLNRPRRVPLWWDAGTMADLTAWLDYRHDQGAMRDDPFVCSLQAATFGEPLNRHVLRRRFHAACRVLGWERLRTLTIHHGRHTFISHALAGGRTLAEVKAAAGHASLLTTSVYLHVVVDEQVQQHHVSFPAHNVHQRQPAIRRAGGFVTSFLEYLGQAPGGVRVVVND